MHAPYELWIFLQWLKEASEEEDEDWHSYSGPRKFKAVLTTYRYLTVCPWMNVVLTTQKPDTAENQNLNLLQRIVRMCQLYPFSSLVWSSNNSSIVKLRCHLVCSLFCSNCRGQFCFNRIVSRKLRHVNCVRKCQVVKD